MVGRVDRYRFRLNPRTKYEYAYPVEGECVMNRDKQIEFMDGAEARHDERATRILSKPAVKSVLRAYDRKVAPKPVLPRRVACA